jgi:hypothetical protein
MPTVGDGLAGIFRILKLSALFKISQKDRSQKSHGDALELLEIPDVFELDIVLGTLLAGYRFFSF